MTEKLFPNEKIIVTKNFDVHQDWGVPIPGFFIVASRNNKVSLTEFTDEEAIEFFTLIRKLRQGMKEVLSIDYVCFFQNENNRHNLFYFWLFPRHKWMAGFGEKVESLRPIITYARENMNSDEVFKEVKLAVIKMKDYMKNFEN